MSDLKRARKYIKRKMGDGCKCPCCRQFVKEYKRSITSTMAYSLILLYRRGLVIGKKEWIHVGEYMNTLDDIPHTIKDSPSKLLYWGLLQTRRKKTSKSYAYTGEYRVTKKGALFVKGEIEVPKYVHLYNNTVLKFSEDQMIDITKALGNKFSLSEIMGY